MKTHGICHAKSARKHRKQGHFTMARPGYAGNFFWSRRWPTDHEVEMMTGDPEQNTYAVIEGRRFHTVVVYEATPVSHAEWFAEGRGLCRISVGDAYWPIRRNQHSKPFRVLGILSAEQATITYDRGEGTPQQTTALTLFRELIGKPYP